MSSNPKPVRSVTTTPSPVEEISLHERIQQRAYELYEERGSQPGNELQDWLEAEAEIMGTTKATTAAA